MAIEFQYVSDIHLEGLGGRLPHINRQAPYLVLAGDIGYPTKRIFRLWMERVSSLFDHVFYVSGNHEYHPCAEQGLDMDAMTGKIRRALAGLPNVHFLNDGPFHLSDRLWIMGTTLWGHVDPATRTEHGWDIESRMTDFRLMLNADGKRWDIDSMNAAHVQQKQQLAGWIAEARAAGARAVVVTHHLPSFAMVTPEYRRYGHLNTCFATHTDDLFADPVCAWVCGHSHAQYSVQINGIPCYLNSIGYVRENVGRKNYHATFKVEMGEQSAAAVAAAAVAAEKH
jgi:hypothetical protein